MDQELIDQLYDSLIRDYSRNPRNYGVMKNYCCSEHGHNTSCGDELTLYIDKDDNTIKDVKWDGDGCALFKSSASLLSEKMIGLDVNKCQSLVKDFISFIVNNTELQDEYEPLHIFSGVKKFPGRVKCVLLPWRTMEQSFNTKGE